LGINGSYDFAERGRGLKSFSQHEADSGETQELELKTGAKASKLIKD
jgi:hypothetical protein